MSMLIGGQNYKILVGPNSFDATVGEYEISFVMSKERLIIKRNGIVVEVDGFFVRSLSGISIKNEGLAFIIEGEDFILTYEVLRFIRFKTNDCSLVVEIKLEEGV